MHRFTLWAVVISLALAVLVALGACDDGSRAPVTSGSDTPASNGGGSGACSGEGTIAPCAIELGTHAGVTDCALGVHVCHGGQWGVCSLDASKPAVHVPAPKVSSDAISTDGHFALSGGIGTRAVGGDAGDCHDPCDPYCLGFADVPDAAISSSPALVDAGYSSAPSLATAGFPSGFVSAGQDPNNSCTQPCTGITCLGACQYDTYCDPAIAAGAATPPSHCKAFSVFQSGPTASCTGIDITSPPTCAITVAGLEQDGMTVCNRGTVAAPAGIQCFAFPGGSPQFGTPNGDPIGTASNGQKAYLLNTTTSVLQPGHCETDYVDFSNVLETTRNRYESLPNGVHSVMCNPPNGVITPVTGGPNYSTNPPVSGTTYTDSPSGSWTNVVAATGVQTPATGDGNDAHASLGTVAVAFPTAGNYINGAAANGWTTPDGADAIGGTAATAAPPQNSVSTSSQPPTAPATTVDWTGLANVEGPTSNADADASATNTSFQTTITSYAGAASDNTCTGGTACQWKTSGTTSVVGMTGFGPPGAVTSMNAGDAASANLYGYIFTFPATAVIVGATIVVDAAATSATDSIEVQMCGATCTPVHTITGLTNTYTGRTVAPFTAAELSTAGVTRTVLGSNGNKIVHITARNPAGGSAAALGIDGVNVAIAYIVPGTKTVSLGTFGLGVPAGTSLTSLTVDARWKSSVASSGATVTVQPRTGTTTLGTAWSLATTSTAFQAASNTFTFGSQPAAAFADGTFFVDVTVTLPNTATSDYILSLDSLRVQGTYTNGSNDATVYFTRLGLSIPSTATIESVTVEASWAASVAGDTYATLGAQLVTGVNVASSGGTPGTMGPELVQNAPPAALASPTPLTFSGAGLTPAMFNDVDGAGNPSFGVRLQARRSNSTNAGNVAFTATVDYVRVTVVYSVGSTTSISLGSFGYTLPPGASISYVTAEARWSITDASGYPAAVTGNANAALTFQLFSNGTALGPVTRATAAGTTPPVTDTTTTMTPYYPAAGALGTNINDFNGSALTLVVTATRPQTQSAALTNSPFTVNLDYVSVTINYNAAIDSHHVNECNGYNNWGVVKSSSAATCQQATITSYPTFVTTRVFKATCPETPPTWKRFLYTTTDPSDSRIEFRLRTFAATNGVCVPLTASTSGATSAVAQSTPTDTQVCSLTTDAGAACPADMVAAGQILSGTKYMECLQMDAVGIANSAGTQPPQLTDWTMLYDCLPSQ